MDKIMKESAFKYFEDLVNMMNSLKFKKGFNYNGNSIFVYNKKNTRVTLLSRHNDKGNLYTDHRIKFFIQNENEMYTSLKPSISFTKNNIIGIFEDKRSRVQSEIIIEDESDWFNIITMEQCDCSINYDEILKIKDILTKSVDFYEIRYSIDEEIEYGY